MLCAAFVTVNVWLAVDDAYVAFPSWVAVTVTSPAPVKARVEPFSNAGPLATENVTSNPLLVVADRVTVFVATWSPMDSNVMLCATSDTSNERSTGVAAS